MGAILNGPSSFTILPLHKSCFNFFPWPNLLSYLLILGSFSVSFSRRSLGQPVWLLFFIVAVQTLDDRGRGRIFISFTFRFSGPNDSLINSQIMRLNVSSPHLDWFGLFLFWSKCVNAAAGSRRKHCDRIDTAIWMKLLFS